MVLQGKPKWLWIGSSTAFGVLTATKLVGWDAPKGVWLLAGLALAVAAIAAVATGDEIDAGDD